MTGETNLNISQERVNRLRADLNKDTLLICICTRLKDHRLKRFQQNYDYSELKLYSSYEEFEAIAKQELVVSIPEGFVIVSGPRITTEFILHREDCFELNTFKLEEVKTAVWGTEATPA